MEKLITELLRELGENPNRDGLKKTPERVSRMWSFLTKGYSQDPSALISSAIFEEENQEMVLLKEIDFYSVCEHHLMPFFGKAHVAYLPNQRIVGLSKLARLVDVYARRLQVQERLTRQVAETLQKELNPQGVAVVLEAEHLCMQMRGVEKQNSVAVTSCMLGAFKENLATRSEFLGLIGHGQRRAY